MITAAINSFTAKTDCKNCEPWGLESVLLHEPPGEADRDQTEALEIMSHYITVNGGKLKSFRRPASEKQRM